MDRFLCTFLDRFSAKLYVPMITVTLFLQRTPVFNSWIAKQFSQAPRIGHLLKWVTGSSVLVGSMNTVTGASASVELIEGFNNTRGPMGEPFQIKFFSKDYVVGSYKLGTTPPPGLSLSPNVSEFGVGTVSGTPSQVGVYNLDIIAYEENNLKGDSVLLALTIYITDKGPSFASHPNNVSMSWGDALFLSSSLADPPGATYQWLKDGIEIEGATSTTYRITNVTSNDEGSYRLRAIQDGVSADSEPGIVTVNASSIETWKETVFSNPFSDIAAEAHDPDLDGKSNLVEYALGTDPQIPDNSPVQEISFERSVLDRYVVYTISKNPDAQGANLIPQYCEDLETPNWLNVLSGIHGMILDDRFASMKVKVPVDSNLYIRFLVTDTLLN